MSKPRNAMQAVLDRAAKADVAESSQPASDVPAPMAPKASSTDKEARERAYDRPSRRNTLLAEAIDLLLTKKAKNRIGTEQAPQ
jgi:hypothetical protein